MTLTLADEVDVSRGDVIAPAATRPAVGDQFEATVVWMADEPLLRGRTYLMRVGTQTVPATVAPIKHKLNVDTLEQIAGDELELNEIGVVDLELSQPIAFDPYADNRDTGGFILIDRITNAHRRRRAARSSRSAARTTCSWQAVEVDRDARAAALRPDAVRRLADRAPRRGQVVGREPRRAAAARARPPHVPARRRQPPPAALSKDLGFTDADRAENIRRAGEVAKLMTDAGLIVLAAFVSPFRADRETARALFDEGEFVEVFVDTTAPSSPPSATRRACTRRRAAASCENLTGLGSLYEPPETPELPARHGRAGRRGRRRARRGGVA